MTCTRLRRRTSARRSSPPLLSIGSGRPDVRQDITVGNPLPGATLYAEGRLFVQVPLTLSWRTFTKGLEAANTVVTDGGALDVTLSPPRFLRINGEPGDVNRTGVSVNPARSIGPAIVGWAATPGAVGQLWLFIAAPLVGAGVAGILFKSGLLSAED